MSPQGNSNGDMEAQIGGPDLLNVKKYRADELPSNVCSRDQLVKLPIEYLSENPSRPLQHVGKANGGEVHEYALNPLTYSVILILTVELLERFAYYGIQYTQTAYLTGSYNKQWNSGMSSVEASSFVSISTAVAYTAPFIGALLADCVLGDYWVIILGMAFLYTPGLILIQLTTIPHFFGASSEFPTNILAFGLLLLWPVGAGCIKSVVNIFGAKQYHPVLQSALIESYYVNFYMCINVGALVGGILVPLVAQKDICKAYAIPVLMLAGGICLFVAFSGRYVRRKPQGDLPQALGALKALFTCSTTDKDTRSTSLSSAPEDPEGKKPFYKTVAYQARQLRNVMMISALVVPFNVAYSQMATIFIVQGTVMKDACYGRIDAALMNNCDAISVLVFGFLVGTYFYPALAARDIKIYTTYKFALGSFCGLLAIGWALILEYWIHSKYEQTGEKVNILWMSFSYFFIGAGEIFAISAAYEVAFAVAPKEQKALSSAINLFCIGGVPNFVCMALYQLCSHWFLNDEGNANIQDIHRYSQAKVYNYFWVLFLIALFGTIINMMPFVRDWVASVEQDVMQRKTTQAGTDGSGKGGPGDSATKKILLEKQRLTSMTATTSDEEADPLLNSVTRIKIGSSANAQRPVTPVPRAPLGTPNKVNLHFNKGKKKTTTKAKPAKEREFVLLNRFGSQYGSTSH